MHAKAPANNCPRASAGPLTSRRISREISADRDPPRSRAVMALLDFLLPSGLDDEGFDFLAADGGELAGRARGVPGRSLLKESDDGLGVPPCGLLLLPVLRADPPSEAVRDDAIPNAGSRVIMMPDPLAAFSALLLCFFSADSLATVISRSSTIATARTHTLPKNTRKLKLCGRLTDSAPGAVGSKQHVDRKGRSSLSPERRQCPRMRHAQYGPSSFSGV